MLKINHMNLSVSDVPALAKFFERCLGFTLTKLHTGDKFAVLHGEDGFLLILTYGKDAAHTSYPPMFHIGLLVAEESIVRVTHQRIIDAGYEVPELGILQRGGPPAFGFYCTAPGGVLVEVSTPSLAQPQLA
jgi:catechol 2,3-dioxygenase-like lactoylglutathione lyase family enzyme